MFILHADKNNLKIEEKEMVTSGSVNVYTCRFTFNSDWDNLAKTAVFKASDISIATELSPTYDEDTKEEYYECNIPWEVMQEYGRTLYIGVRGNEGETIVLPTIWASAGPIKQGVLSSDAGTDIPANKYDELKEDISKKGDSLEYNGIDLNLLSNGETISTVQIVGGDSSGGTVTTGVLSFNGRTGRVVPKKGDYTADMVGALPSTTSIPSMPEDIGADPAGAGEAAAEKVKEEIIESLDNKLDNTGGTVTGEIVFTDVSISLQRDANETNETIVDSTGIHYNGTGVLQIENNGISVIDEIKYEIPKYISQLENDLNFVDEEYVKDAISSIKTNSDEVYSTEEVRIGTWIDGKPLYRKVFHNFNAAPINTWTNVLNVKDIEIDVLIDAYGFQNNTVPKASTIFPCRDVNIGLTNDKNNLTMYVSGGGQAGQVSTLIIEYTKTTD